ncbi:MAG TPA: tetratricopeptide repeat protein, partial [Acidobacteriaceae bacterium]|nr:tetratricopeptide repeat protein [Acidobacteriaceae bacterium]
MSLLVAAFVSPMLQAQTYSVGAGASAEPQKRTEPKQAASQQSLGFGTNIQNARLANAAESALKRHDYAVALAYAQRAAQAAPNDPQLWFLVGYTARLDRSYVRSVDAYTRGLRLKPGSVEGMSGLAQTYSLIGRNDEAESLLKQVIASNPSRRDDLLLLGNLYMKSGDYQGALDWLRRAERLQPDARSELLLAISYQHLKKMDMASHYLNLAKQRAPNNPDVQRSLAGYYREVGNYPAAIAALKSIRNPKPDVTAELAYTYQLAGKLNQSAKFYSQAANARPKDLNLQLSAAQAQVAAGYVKDASQFLQRAEGLNPDYYRLHAIRGEIAQMKEQNEDAVREYRAAIAHLPSNPTEGPLYGIQLHMNLMGLYRSLNDNVAAQQQLQTAQTQIGALNEQGSGRAAFLRLRGMIEMNEGQLDRALNDVKEAIAMSPNDPGNLQLHGDVLMKMGRTEDAIANYKKVLGIDPRNRAALISLGYASRAAGHDQDAEKYFKRLAQIDPSLYVPYLALGDMYTAHRQFSKAEASYRKGNLLAPGNGLIVAGGMNAAIESHNLNLAAMWLDRSTAKMQQEPQLLKERERYLNFKQDYRQSAEVGRKAIQVLPHDREVVVYLGYDLLHLGKFDELLHLTSKYNDAFPEEADIPLLAGYAHKYYGQRELAMKDFTEALKRDSKVVTAYVNRGYLFNDLHKPDDAAADFESALKLDPRNGTAHLGLAFADLERNHSQAALHNSELAEKELGDSQPIHMIRATAYGREGRLTKAAGEYRAALKFTPNDGAIYRALANIWFAQGRYHQAVDELQTAQKLSPNDAAIYALLARTYAHLQDKAQTLRNVALAERLAQQPPPAGQNLKSESSQESEIFVATGDALSTLGDQKAAMERFAKALTVPQSDRVGVRLAVAHLMAQQGHNADAERQIALAQMEADAGDTAQPTGAQIIEAASIFQQMHEYQLSLTYLDRAKAAGAPDIAVRISRANSYLALGDTTRAAAELAAVKQVDGSESDYYPYLLAEANVFEQQHQGPQALSSFAEAASAAGEDQTAEQGLLQAGASEGFRISPKLSLLGNFILQPAFDDSTIYVLDSKLFGPVPVPPSNLSLLPPPRSNLVSEGTAAYHLHLGNIPTIGGFFQIRNARGIISSPATNSIVNRDTTDYSLNLGVNPAVRLGRNVMTFDVGVQGTIRRDSRSPLQMNQNLGRAFAYMSTTSFFNVVSANGYLLYEFGPFTESNLHSRMLASALNFRVGNPWAKTALVAGWGSNDQQFTPVGIENYNTSSYVGLTHRFSPRWNVEAIIEDLRGWRVVGVRSGNSQAVR